MTDPKAIFLLALLLGAVASCGSAAPTGSPDDAGVAKDVRAPTPDAPAEGATATGQVEIYSWWVSGGELQALNSMLALYQLTYPNVKVVNATGTNATTAEATVAKDMATGQPPDTFQANGGAEVMQYVVTNGSAANSKLQTLDALSESEGWKFPPAVTAPISFDGHLYAVPVDLQRENVLYYSVSLFKTAGIDPPTSKTTWPEFVALCQSLIAKNITPIAIGLQGVTAKGGAGNSWTLQIPLFEGIFAGVQGANYYEDYMTGKKTADDANMRVALDDGVELLQSSDLMLGDKGAEARSWSDACDQVHTGKAAMTLMGDWAKGYLVSVGWTPGTDFGEVMVPVSPNQQPGLFIFSTDTFVLPLGIEDQANTESLLKVFGSRKGQELFNPIKGALPARVDADVSSFDVLAQASYHDFLTLPLAPSDSILLSEAPGDAISVGVANYIADVKSGADTATEENDVISAFASIYSELAAPR